MNKHTVFLNHPCDSYSSGYTHTMLYLSIMYLRKKNSQPKGRINGTLALNRNTSVNIEMLKAWLYAISKYTFSELFWMSILPIVNPA